MSDRDEELGRALRDLPAPPHREGFHAELRARLEDEAASRRATRRAWRPWRAGDPRASGSAARRRPGAGADRRAARRRLGPALAGATALAAAIVLVLALLPGRVDRGIVTAPAQAAQVVERARAALAEVRSLRATLVVRGRLNAQEPLTTDRLRVALTDRGDLRVLGSAQDGDFYYSSRDAREVQLDLPYAPGSFVTEGVAPGAPDGLIGDRRLGLQAAAVTRALAAARTGTVRAERVDGRPAWVLRADIPVNKLGYSGDRLEVVVDRETGFPLSVRETLQGRLVQGFALENLRLNPSLPASAFSPEIPADATVVDEGFRTVPFSAVRERVGYQPLAPRALPAGFGRSVTRVAETTPSPTGNEAMNPPSRDVVSTAYRRGLDTVIVSTRRTGADPDAWADPIASGEGNLVEPERVRIRAGALRGATANVVLDPRVEPHVYVVTDDLVVTITGPLTREELLAAAASLTG